MAKTKLIKHAQKKGMIACKIMKDGINQNETKSKLNKESESIQR